LMKLDRQCPIHCISHWKLKKILPKWYISGD